MFRKLSFVFWSLLCFSATSLSSDELVKIDKTKTYTVSTYSDDFISELLFKELAADLKFKFVSYPSFSSALEAVESGETDFIANVVSTDDRKERLDFSIPTNVQQIYFFSENSDVDFSLVKKIAVPERDISHRVFKSMFPDVEVVYYSGYKNAAKLIHENVVDGVVAPINYLRDLSRKGYYAQHMGNRYPLRPASIVTSKGKNKELIKYFGNESRQEEFQRSYIEKFDNYENELRALSLRKRMEIEEIVITTPLKIKLLNSNLHAEYLNDGSMRGISYDVVVKACNILSIPCKIVNESEEMWSSMYQDLLDNNIDILAPLSKTKERSDYFKFSKPYYYEDVFLVKRKGYKHNYYHEVSDLFLERVAAIENVAFASTLNRHLPNKTLYYFKTNEEMINALLNNEVDYITLTKGTYNELIINSQGHLPITSVESIGVIESFPANVGFQNNERGEKLSKIFNGAINLIELKTIHKKYERSINWMETTSKQHELNTIVFLLFSAFIILLGSIISYWRVKSRTDALTNLGNRYSLYSTFGKGIPKDYCLIYFDLNKFKAINDNFSHFVGDEVLKAIAKKIEQFWPGRAYRIGGDEFVLIGKMHGLEVIRNKMSSIGYFNYITDNNDVVPVGVSYGIYHDKKESRSLAEILQRADNEMYKYKS